MTQRALKKHKVGFETEFLLLEEDGSVSARADLFMKAAEKLKLPYPVHHDYTHNMFEISSVANVRVRAGIHKWIETPDLLTELARRMDLRIYPYGTYPGLHVPAPHTDKYYRMCESVLGPAKYTYCTGHVCGFHIHYTLPYGTLNRETRNLRALFRSKNKEDLLSLYNMIVAFDPILTTFTQSSPFLDGEHFAKDTRMLLYRDMRISKGGHVITGLYREHPVWGRLPRYVHTHGDLVHRIARRHESLREILEEKYPDYLDVFHSRHVLQLTWGPLRINRAGTLEYRGPDVNLPSYLLGSSLLFKYVLRNVHKLDLRVVPSDTGISEAFKIEGDKIYVPPHSYVDDVLQYKSALDGLANDELYNYAKRFLNFARKFLPHRRDPGLSRILEMMETRKTKSDAILRQARKAGHSLKEPLPDYLAKELALRGAMELEKEVASVLTKELLIDMEE